MILILSQCRSRCTRLYYHTICTPLNQISLPAQAYTAYVHLQLILYGNARSPCHKIQIYSSMADTTFMIIPNNNNRETGMLKFRGVTILAGQTIRPVLSIFVQNCLTCADPIGAGLLPTHLVLYSRENVRNPQKSCKIGCKHPQYLFWASIWDVSCIKCSQWCADTKLLITRCKFQLHPSFSPQPLIKSQPLSNASDYDICGKGAKFGHAGVSCLYTYMFKFIYSFK